MAWNGYTVVDMDAHIRERADKFFKDYIDPEYRAPFNLLCEAIARQEEKGDRYALFGSTTAVIEQIEAGRALGVRDTFGLTARSEMEHGRIAFPPGRKDAAAADPPGGQLGRRRRGSKTWTRAHVDVNVLFPTHVSSYCALRDVGFENALYRAYHRWVVDFCAQAPKRLKWTARRQYARRALRRRRAQILGRARPEPRRRLHLAAGARRQTARQPRPLPALRRGAIARPAAPGAWRHGASALRPRHARSRRRVVPAARALATRGPAWRRWAP